MTPTIHIQNAEFIYDSKILFSNLNLDLDAKKWVGLIGPSGVGKSTLLRMLAGVTGTTEKIKGLIFADNHLPVKEQIAYMAQTDLLLPWMTVLNNVTLGLKLRKYSRMHASHEIEKAKGLLERVGLADVMHFYPHQLSGGMRQRTALVRTLMQNKPIVLMDEPFSAVDAITRYKLQNLAASLLKDKTVLFITHDPIEALRLANTIYIMQGSPAKLKLITALNSETPRELADAEMIKLQSVLFHELTQAANAEI